MNTLEEYLKDNPKTHLIFDFDETILKLLLPWEEWFIYVADKIRERYPQFQEKDYVQIHNLLVNQYGQEALDLIRELNEKFESEKVAGIEKNETIISFIKSHSEYKYLLWSSNSRGVVDRFLKELKIEDVFDKIATRSNSDYIKPNISGFRLIEDKTIPRRNYLFIGDSSNDQEAAISLGIDFFKIDYFEPTD